MADEKPPLPFYMEESNSASKDKKTVEKNYQEFKRIDPNDNTVTTKVKVIKMLSTGSLEDLLRTIYQFKKAAVKMNCGTGPKKYDNFELVLDGHLLGRWERIIDGKNRTNETFQESLLELIKYKCPKEDAFEVQQEHLRNVHKNRLINVADFAERLEDLNLYSKELPGAEDGEILTDTELKRILFKAMPKAWRDEE